MSDYKKELNELEEKGLKRITEMTAPFSTTNFSSNDYLGLSHHPQVQEAAIRAVHEYGTGGRSSRLLAGTTSLHQEMERDLAAFLGKEAALVFGSGYHVNTGLIPALVQSGDVVFVDRLCHASICDGVRLSDARFVTFRHNDTGHLEKLLSEKRGSYQKALIITEGIFSMDGDRSPLMDIVRLARQFDGMTYVDEAHSLGVIGPEGKGWAAESTVLPDIDFLIGTFSKALGSQGGFVAASQSRIDYILSRCRSFIYTTALNPAAVGAARESLRLLPTLHARRQRLRESAARLTADLANLDYDVMGDRQNPTPIIPVWTGSIEETKNLSNHLKKLGFFVPSIRPPTVPTGEARIRLSLVYDVLGETTIQLINAFSTYPSRPSRTGSFLAKK